MRHRFPRNSGLVWCGGVYFIISLYVWECFSVVIVLKTLIYQTSSIGGGVAAIGRWCWVN